MSDHEHTALPQGTGTGDRSTGQLIRQAREASGLHIVALAAALKVPVRKLEALEANRWEELTDATFARALASSVARHLKIDVSLVLAGLPSVKPAALSSPAGLGRVGSDVGPTVLTVLPQALLRGRNAWLVGLLLLAAVGLYFFPQVKSMWADSPQPQAELSPATVPASGVSVGVEMVSEPAAPVTPAIAPAMSAPDPAMTLSPPVVAVAPVAQSPTLGTVTNSGSGGVLTIAASSDSWIEVTDSTQRLRIQRVLKQGEEVFFAEGAPFSVVIGNALGARVLVRGEPLDLVGIARNNVARFEVK